MKLALPSCIDMGRNEDKYWLACQAEGQVFQPVPIEVLGGWHEDGVQVVKRVGQALARSTGQEENEVVRHLSRK